MHIQLDFPSTPWSAARIPHPAGLSGEHPRWRGTLSGAA